MHRAGALEREQLQLEDWQQAQDRLAETEQRMTDVVEELGLTGLVTSITFLSSFFSSSIFSHTFYPLLFATFLSVFYLSGLAPLQKLSFSFTFLSLLPFFSFPLFSCLPFSPSV